MESVAFSRKERNSLASDSVKGGGECSRARNETAGTVLSTTKKPLSENNYQP